MNLKCFFWFLFWVPKVPCTGCVFLPFAQTTKLTNSKGSQTCDNNLDLWSEKTNTWTKTSTKYRYQIYINLQEDEGFLSSKWGYNLLMKCPIGTDGHITWSQSYTKRTEPNWDIRVKLKEPVIVVCHSFIPWRSTPQSTSKLVESSDSHHTLQPQLHLVTAACPGEIETVVRPTSHLLEGSSLGPQISL